MINGRGRVALPDPAVVVLVGPAGSGKSTWAEARYTAAEIVSSDRLRSVVGSGPADLDASTDAFAVLDLVIRARIGRGLTTVIDTLGLDDTRRADWLRLARATGLPAVAVVFDTPATVCRARNAARDRPVPAPALTRQLRTAAALNPRIDAEGWDLVVRPDTAAAADESAAGPVADNSSVADSTTGSDSGKPDSAGVELILQLSAFDWGDDPAGWLTSIAKAAAAAGFAGIALMDHLIQIPQVGRAWDPIPEPYTTLGLLAGAAPGLRLGTLVSPVTWRPAGVLAKTVATLDALTGGRAFCGLGAGWWDREHAAFGVPMPPAGERLDRLEQTVETIRALWAPGTKPYAGQRVSLPETTCYPRPAGHPEIIIGGRGDRTLAVAARGADAINLSTSDSAVIADRTAVLHRQCAGIGRDPAEIGVTVLDLPVIGRDREAVATTVERLRGRTAATTYSRRHHAGLAADHAARYAELAGLGVRTVFVGMQGLRRPDDLAVWTEVRDRLGK